MHTSKKPSYAPKPVGEVFWTQEAGEAQKGNVMVAKKKPVQRPKPFKPLKPSGKAGNYRADVDTTGMDPEMMKTLGIKPMKKKR